MGDNWYNFYISAVSDEMHLGARLGYSFMTAPSLKKSEILWRHAAAAGVHPIRSISEHEERSFKAADSSAAVRDYMAPKVWACIRHLLQCWFFSRTSRTKVDRIQAAKRPFVPVLVPER
jgi:hypothetical protein